MHVTLLTTDVSPTTGIGTVLHELVHGLQADPTVRLTVLAMRTTRHRGPLPAGVDVRYVLPRWTPTFRLRPHKLLPIVFPRVELEATDLVHAVIEFPYAMLAERLARRAGVPYLVSIHGRYGAMPFRAWENRALYRGAIRRAAAVTACSAFAAEALKAASGVPREVDVVGNPVDFDRFQLPVAPAAVRRRLGVAPHERIILDVAALKPVKGIDVLIRAFAVAARDVPDLVLVVAGGGDGAPYRNVARELGIADRVRFPGPLDGTELVGAYQQCELFVHLPRYEGFGIVYLEAGACGKPVIGTRTAGVPEAVREGETGCLVAEGDVAAAGAAIVNVLRDPALASRLGEAGRMWAGAHDRRVFAQRLAAIYRRVAGGSAAAVTETTAAGTAAMRAA